MNPTSLAGTGSEVQSAVVDLHVDLPFFFFLHVDLPFYENQSKHRDDGTVKGSVKHRLTAGGLHDYFENTTAPRPATAVELPPVSIFNSKAAGYFSPGHGSIRRLVRFMQEEEERYQFVWREDHVGCYMLQSDHTDKYLLINKLAPHVFSIMNERGEILLCIFTRSTSYSDPSLVMACESLFGDGQMLPQFAWLDCPTRDGPGLAKLVPSLQRAALGGAFQFEGTIHYIASELSPEYTKAITALNKLDTLGFDIENWSEMRAGVPNHDTSVIQLCGSATDCYVFHVHNFDCVRKSAAARSTDRGNLILPLDLVDLLASKELTGVNIKGDITNLKKAFPACTRLKKLVEVNDLLKDHRLLKMIAGPRTGRGVQALVRLLLHQDFDKLGNDAAARM